MFKNFIIVSILCSNIFNCCLAATEEDKISQMKEKINTSSYKYFVTNNVLGLADKQIEIRNNSIISNSQVLNNYFNLYSKECHTLEVMKKAKVSIAQLKNQEKIIKKYEKGINNLLKTEDKEFKKCLTNKQKAKYRIIKKLERNNISKTNKQKDYYLTNPELKRFGN